jgi:hypothetical protein
MQSQTMQLLTSNITPEWYTPAEYIEAARQVMGSIELDPASSEIANQVVKATRIYTKETDGLSRLFSSWQAESVWLNPPYGKSGGDSYAGLFSGRLVAEYQAGNVKQAILLVNLYSAYKWFAPLFNYDWCVPDHRICFHNPETGKSDEEAKASSVFIYFGNRTEQFAKVFSQFGFICQPKKY